MIMIRSTILTGLLSALILSNPATAVPPVLDENGWAMQDGEYLRACPHPGMTPQWVDCGERWRVMAWHGITIADTEEARAHLAGLLAGKIVNYIIFEPDKPHDPRLVHVFAGDEDVGCAMVRDGFATKAADRICR
jgi:hypothetical protein